MIPETTSRLGRGHRRLVVWTAITLALTGLAWMAGYYAVVLAPDLDSSEARSLLHLIVETHGVLGYGGAVLLGTLLGRHIPAGLRGGRKLVSGLIALTLAALLIVSALVLYYAAGETVRQAGSFLHQAAGVLATALVTVHVRLRGRRRA